MRVCTMISHELIGFAFDVLKIVMKERRAEV